MVVVFVMALQVLVVLTLEFVMALQVLVVLTLDHLWDALDPVVPVVVFVLALQALVLVVSSHQPYFQHRSLLFLK